MPGIIALLGLFVVLTVISAWRLSTKKRNVGIKGWIKDSDLDGKGGTYCSDRIGIAAKPDVVIDLSERRKKVIETKNTVCKTRIPYKADVIQLAAAMEAVGAREGEIRYRNKAFLVDYTEKLKKELREMKAEMDKTRTFGIPPKGTPSKKKCGACDFNEECPDAAAGGGRQY